jgi:hypothetical protein
MEDDAQDAVGVLALEPEGLAGVLGGKLGIVLEARALCPPDVEPPFIDAEEDEHGNEIDNEELEHPPPRQGLHHLDVGKNPVPPGQRRSDPQDVVGKEILRQPLDDLHDLRRE